MDFVYFMMLAKETGIILSRKAAKKICKFTVSKLCNELA